MHYDSYLFKIKLDLDFHLDFELSFMLRVFKLGTESGIFTVYAQGGKKLIWK